MQQQDEEQKAGNQRNTLSALEGGNSSFGADSTTVGEESED
jgi:hypothetical protein